MENIWTPRAVARADQYKYAMLAINADYNEKRDVFSYRIDGEYIEWHRRGSPYFKSRGECVQWAAYNHHPLG
jgi:hypothetical protein